MTQHMVVIRPTELSNFLFGGDPPPRLAVAVDQEEWGSAPEGGRSNLVLHFSIRAGGDCAPGHAVVFASAVGWHVGFEIRLVSVFPMSHTPGVLSGNPLPCPASLAPALEDAIQAYVAFRVLAEEVLLADGKFECLRRLRLLWDGRAYGPGAVGWEDVH